MSSQFLLPCECGQATPIQLSQAGQSVRCSCGRSLTVPSLRGIQQLKTVDESTLAPTAPTRSWNPTRGILFGIGAASILIGLVVLGFHYPNYRYASRYQPSEENLQQNLKAIDNSSPEDLWKMWHDASIRGMGEHETSFFVQARAMKARFRRFVITGAVLVGVGFVLITSSMLIRGSVAKNG